MKKIILLLTLLSLPFASAACSCDPAYNDRGFCQVVHDAQDQPMFCVVKARILSFYHYGIKAQVIDNIYNTASGDTIVVWGDNGACCRPTFVTMSAVGDTLIMALEQTDLMGNTIAPLAPDYEDTTDYVLQGCGNYYLHYHNGKVTGGFNSYLANDTIAYPGFTDHLLNCLKQLSVGETVVSEPRIYPNPFSNWVHINCSETVKKIFLYNSAGQVVLQTGAGTPALSLDLTAPALPRGIYLLRICTAGHSYSKTLIRE